jgi:DNA polymerase-3 subunit beta
MRASTSNLETATSNIFDIDNKTEEFNAAVPFKMFYDFLSAMNDKDVSIFYDELQKNMLVEGDGSKANIKCYPAEDFPVLAKFDEFKTELIRMPTAEFKLAVSHTSFAASVQSYNTVLTGVFIASELDNIVFVATDSFRFSVQRLAIKPANEFKVIIPFGALENVAKIVSDKSVLIAVDNSKVIFKSGNTEIICLQIDGAYIDHTILETMCQKEPVVSVTVSTADLIRACKQTALFSDNNRQIVNIDIQPLIVTVSAKSDQAGDGTSSITGQVIGEPLTVRLDYKYLNELLSSIKTPQVHFDVLGKNAIVVFRLEGKPGFYHAIMPIAN